MKLAAGFSADDLKVFLQEADEQIQLLDEDFIRLERESDNTALLQEIFRAAHTLKGSSAMLGFREMADLTHQMEGLLDRLRNGAVAVSAHLVDALLRSLDALKVLVQNLASGTDTPVDIAPLVAALQAAYAGPPAAASAGGTKPKPAAGEALGHEQLRRALKENPAASEALEAARASGVEPYAVTIAVEHDSPWAAVRCFQLLNEITSLGDLVCSVPSREQIEREEVGHRLEFVLATSSGENKIREAVKSVAEVEVTEIVPWRFAEEATPVAPSTPGRAAGVEATEQAMVGAAVSAQPAVEQPQAARSDPAQAMRGDVAQTIRIDVDRLDDLMNMIGELVIDRTRVTQLAKQLQSRYRDDELVAALEETTTHVAKVVSGLHESMMETRMLPIGTLFSKYPRMVRDLARNSDKNVNFVLEGEDTEIDRSVIEKIKDPLVHLLRNAVDHGVETPEARLAANKSEQALVKLSAFHDQGHIVITLEDDGRGIDAGVIRESATRKGVLSAEAAARLSDHEAIDLIFEPGFSTKEQATEVSGRGVGMDVVRRSIAALNGTVRVDTQVGAGTKFRLQLPLTLATFRGLLVSAGGIVYAIPLNYVQEAATLASSSVRTIMSKEVLHFRGSIMPLVHLSAVCRTMADDGMASADGYVVIITAGGRQVGLAVERLIEQQEIVVKPLDDFVGESNGVAGASILGDGQVALILDVNTIVKTATQREV